MIISGENETDDIGYEGLLGIDIYLNHPDMTTKLLYEIIDGGHSSAIPHSEPVRMKVINWLKFLDHLWLMQQYAQNVQTNYHHKS